MKKYIILFIAIPLLVACKRSVKDAEMVASYPDIFPDYINVTIPATIAPMNFDMVTDSYNRIDVKVVGAKSGELHINKKQTADFPHKAWAQLLAENIGDSLQFTVAIHQDGKWLQYKPFSMYVSTYPIDYGLVYRKIAPGYEVWSKMGIYERDLSSFDEKPIIENTLTPAMCVNCHSLNQASPNQVSLHIRGKNGGTLLRIDNQMEMLNTKTDSTISSCVYPYWHPDGKYIAYSVNETRQAFHTAKDERVEVLDLASDVVIYHPESNELILVPQLRQKESFETFPVFSADGKKLYFCSAETKAIPFEYKDIKYSLCSVDFDAATGQVGTIVDTLINAKTIDKSISFPRPSYDGKYIMVTLSDYGNFSIWHKEADLWLYDLSNGSFKPIDEVNSDNTESFHNWGSDSRWFVFSSRRGDGLYTRLYLACMNEDGTFTKPFLLPQKEPKRFYDYSVFSYNVPDFVTAPLEVDIRTAEKMIVKDERKQIIIRN